MRLGLEGGALRIGVEAPFHDDPAPPGPPGPCWELWEHEVVELLVLGEAERYTEIELGPHGHHLVLRLEGRRNIVERALAIAFRATREGGRWRGEALIPGEYLPPRPWRGNAYSIHGQGSQRRYLAWTPVPGATPDFHRLESFAPLDLWP